MEYTPDGWVLLKLESSEGSIYKILAGWNGGYLSTNSWRLSSGVASIRKEEARAVITNYSGSVYYCYFGLEGCLGYARRKLQELQDCEGVDVTVLSISNFEL